jgi:hypothetical protein
VRATVVGVYHRARHSDRVLAPCHVVLPREMLSYHRTPRWQGLNADMVAGSWRCGVRRQMYISRNFWFVHLFFENHEKNIKKFRFVGSRANSIPAVAALASVWPTSHYAQLAMAPADWFHLARQIDGVRNIASSEVRHVHERT